MELIERDPAGLKSREPVRRADAGSGECRGSSPFGDWRSAAVPRQITFGVADVHITPASGIAKSGRPIGATIRMYAIKALGDTLLDDMRKNYLVEAFHRRYRTTETRHYEIIVGWLKPEVWSGPSSDRCPQAMGRGHPSRKSPGLRAWRDQAASRRAQSPGHRSSRPRQRRVHRRAPTAARRSSDALEGGRRPARGRHGIAKWSPRQRPILWASWCKRDSGATREVRRQTSVFSGRVNAVSFERQLSPGTSIVMGMSTPRSRRGPADPSHNAVLKI